LRPVFAQAVTVTLTPSLVNVRTFPDRRIRDPGDRWGFDRRRGRGRKGKRRRKTN
jgi:hypothetical protein